MRILEETWRSLIENAPNIITIIDRKEKVQYINRTISGINTKDVIGRDICDYIQPEYHEMVKKIIRKVFETGEHGSYEIRAVDTSGRISWFETKVGPIKQEEEIDAVALISTDITESKNLEHKLKESEQRYRLITENSSDVISITDMNFKVIYVSPSIEQLLGYTPEEILEMPMNIPNPPDTIKKINDLFKKASKEGKSENQDLNRTYSVEVEQIHKDGYKVDVEIRARFMRNSEDIPIGILVIFQNISERKKAEQNLRESEEKFRTISNESMLGIIILQDNILKYVNEKTEEIINYPISEMRNWKSREFLKVIHPEDQEYVINIIMKLISKRESSVHYIFRVLKKNGDIVWLDNYSKIITYNGRIAIMATFADITEKIEAEQKLKESEEQFRLFAEQSQMGIVLSQADAIKYVNQAMSIINEYSIEEMMSWTSSDYLNGIHPEDIPEVIERNKQRKSGELSETSSFICRIITKTGKVKWIEVYGKQIIYSGKLASLNSMIDITEIKEVEQKLRKALNRAEFYKDLFAHDINNLMQGILSSNELLELLFKDAELTPQINKALSIINEQIDRGSKLVYNVRKLSQIEEQEIILEKIEIVSILKKTIEYVKNSFHDKLINISLGLFSEEIYINGNELIEDVFENLLINAVKHNNNPTVDLIVRISKEKIDGLSKYKFEFIDNGKGIEDRRKSLIFQRVERDAKSVTGMGLGLSLVKKIIDTYEGEIWVENRIKNDYSKGSAFNILLPED